MQPKFHSLMFRFGIYIFQDVNLVCPEHKLLYHIHFSMDCPALWSIDSHVLYLSAAQVSEHNIQLWHFYCPCCPCCCPHYSCCCLHCSCCYLRCSCCCPHCSCCCLHCSCCCPCCPCCCLHCSCCCPRCSCCCLHCSCCCLCHSCYCPC